MELELRHLRVVVAVADAGSIGAAARALGLDQPLVSRQLRRIEAALGAVLFHRGAGGATLTPAGAELVARARPLVQEFDALVRPRAAGLAVRLGSSALGIVAGELVDRLEALFGTPVSALTHHSAVHLLSQLGAAELDLVLVAEFDGTPLPFPAQVRRVVLVEREPALVALAEQHALAARHPLCLADLAGESWVVPGLSEDGEREAFAAACAAAGFAPRVRHVTDDVSLVRRAVTSGQAVLTVLPQSAERGGYVLRALEGHPLHRRLHLAWRPERVPAAPGELLCAVRAAYAAHTGANREVARWWAANGWPADGSAGAPGATP